eukprot:CAMPEP_0172197892 /NCGR_PEP_ID=MMETSP1050-20130122/27760_1 /TAXON_ID=233186 /ORGANISM="Cryptomonas curvata, Strain CCAP979/52" /LENGTH=135 /DNA_ID=CAMNT_0012874605 /DNA_START=238 /DNA_END=641 /DNA_ORIENTATION=+
MQALTVTRNAQEDPEHPVLVTASVYSAPRSVFATTTGSGQTALQPAQSPTARFAPAGAPAWQRSAGESPVAAPMAGVDQAAPSNARAEPTHPAPTRASARAMGPAPASPDGAASTAASHAPAPTSSPATCAAVAP